MHSHSIYVWIGFIAFILFLLFIDLGLFQKEDKEMKWKESLFWAIFWVSLAMVFNVLVYYVYGKTVALEFLAGFLIEKALSVDNLFVFLVIFSFFAVPKKLQHRVIFWGVFGAMLMRGVFVGLGTLLLSKFHWVTYVFGGFLVITGFKTMFSKDEEKDLSQSLFIKVVKKIMPLSPNYHGNHFFIKQDGRWVATMLFLVLLTVEFTDVVFAIDSVPAVFAVSSDPFIVYSSNIFAILGLRALFFLLSGAMDQLKYLKLGLGLVLAYVGVKMMMVEFYKIPIGVSLAIIGGVFAISIAASLVHNHLEKKASNSKKKLAS